jgi:hypothetical protein
MQTLKARRLAETIAQKKEDLKMLCQGLDEDTASRAPSGRWSPKQIVSHLCGPEGIGMLPTIKAFIEEDNPRLDIGAEDPFFSERRAEMTFAELFEAFEREYDRMAEFVSTLSEEQLSRKASIPMLKESPIGENPTLSQWVEALGDYHLGWHIDHMREVLEGLGTELGPRPEQVSRETQEQPTYVI